eukprot:8584101-Pyramimonas_sp.AAC.1
MKYPVQPAVQAGCPLLHELGRAGVRRVRGLHHCILVRIWNTWRGHGCRIPDAHVGCVPGKGLQSCRHEVLCARVRASARTWRK